MSKIWWKIVRFCTFLGTKFPGSCHFQFPVPVLNLEPGFPVPIPVLDALPLTQDGSFARAWMDLFQKLMNEHADDRNWNSDFLNQCILTTNYDHRWLALGRDTDPDQQNRAKNASKLMDQPANQRTTYCEWLSSIFKLVKNIAPKRATWSWFENGLINQNVHILKKCPLSLRCLNRVTSFSTAFFQCIGPTHVLTV